MKRFLAWLSALMLLCLPVSAFAADSLPQGGASPNPPLSSKFGEDGLSYEDSSISVHIEKSELEGTPVYFVTVQIQDVSQLRTALAGKARSKAVRPVNVMAKQNNAVLAINGDFFNYHSTGIVVRSGEILRESPVSSRDTLVIDDNGDFKLLTQNTRKEWEDWKANGTGVREAFCFGPALIIDGEKVSYKYQEKVSCGAKTPAQRIIFCQTGPLSYLIIACEGMEQNKSWGLTLDQMTDMALEHGAIQAYNLDGGSSVTIMLGDTKINAPDSKYRDVGDIIYFATLGE